MATSTAGRKPRTARRIETYNIYIYKVLKQVYPEMGMSKKAMVLVNDIVHDLFERLAGEAGNMCKHNKKQTLDSNALKAAVKIILPGEIAKHAVSEAQKALAKYHGSLTN
jgi:histone H3/H4